MKPLYSANPESTEKWYNKTEWIIFWILLFFPIGFYGLVRSKNLSLKWKSIISACFLSVIAVSYIKQEFKQYDLNTGVERTYDSMRTVQLRSLERDIERQKQFKLEETEKSTTSNWKYSNSVDRMTSQTTPFASLESSNEVDFKFPYNGGSKFILFVRKDQRGNEIILQCEKCQFIHNYGSENIIVKFDNGSPERYSFSTPRDGSLDVIFLEPATKFLKKLKTFKHVLFKALFYQDGEKYIDFDSYGLEWSR